MAASLAISVDQHPNLQGGVNPRVTRRGVPFLMSPPKFLRAAGSSLELPGVLYARHPFNLYEWSYQVKVQEESRYFSSTDTQKYAADLLSSISDLLPLS